MNEFLETLEQLIQLEEQQTMNNAKKRQQIVDAGRLVLLEHDLVKKKFVSHDVLKSYEEVMLAYIESLQYFSYEELYVQARRVLMFHRLKLDQQIY